MTKAAPSNDAHQTHDEIEKGDASYLAQVMSEIDEEVRRRRSCGDLPIRIERELDELFLEHAPVGGRDGGNLSEALRMVDATVFIDPVVPIESAKSGGAVIKKGMRSLSLWYVGYVTHQVSHFASAVSRSLHILDDQLQEIQRELSSQQRPLSQIVEMPDSHNQDAWWVKELKSQLPVDPGRVLHSACGNGWLVKALNEIGVNAYGVDPRPGKVDETATNGLDIRQDEITHHLRSVGRGSLGCLVLTGIVDGMESMQRNELIDLINESLSPDATLFIHSMTTTAWALEDMPIEVDLCQGHPLRAKTWIGLLSPLGYEVTLKLAPSGMDYMVTAVRRHSPPSL